MITYLRILSLGALYVILFLFSLLQLSYLNVILFYITNILFLFLQFKLTLPRAFFHSSILTAIMGISELIAMGVILEFFPHFLSTELVGLFFYGIFSKSLFFTIIYLITRILNPQNKTWETYDRSDLFLIVIPLSSIFVLLTFFTIGETESFAPPITIMVSVSAAFLLLTNLLVFGINQYNQKKNREFTEMQLLLQKESDTAEYYEMLLSQNENRNILVHDLKKHLESIKLLNEKGETEKINAYILSLMDASDLKENFRICEDSLLNAILNRYQLQCRENKIAFHADIRSNTLQQFEPHDLTSLFCNLLDNAVEATKNIPNAFIELTVQKKEDLPFIVIIVINSCRSMPKYDHNGFPISDKTDKHRHGFGIKSIRKAVKQYHGDLQMYYDTDSATFHTIITLKQ